jgi:hypothetical protein
MSLGPEKARLSRAVKVANDNPWLQQFGQSNDDAAFNGSTACTHVVCQYLALLWKGKRYTINEVNNLAGMPYRATKLVNGFRVPRGMNNLEFQRFCDRVGLPYVVRFGLSFETVLTYSNKAPVFYGNRYGSEPRKKGARYNGVTAKPPFADLHGATQLTGSLINGRHAVVILGYRSIISDISGKVVAYRAWRKDPNHGSPSRPERPPFDLIKTTQAKQEYLDYTDVSSSRVYCALPTRSLPV